MIYSIADLLIKCDFEYDKMLSRAKMYSVTTKQCSEYTFDINRQEVENRMLKYPNIPKDQNEVISSAQIFFEKAINYRRVLLHAVAIAFDGDAYLFFAPPSGGKSTMANNWKKILGKRASIISDDSPIIGVKPQGAFIWNSCWSKITEEMLPNEYPVKGIGIIYKNNINSVISITVEEAVNDIVIGYPEGACRNMVKELLNISFSNVKCWKCYCDESQNAAKLTLKKMVGEYYEK